MPEYAIKPFVKEYKGGKLGHWSPWSEIRVQAGSLEEALRTGEERLLSEARQNNINIACHLIDHVIEPGGRHLQITAWDESGFPI